ncbi:MAG TPA: lamin tail domain-containing protein [Nocardioidaceae bacterium]|nr:lamin tail domain-containing protein [Nocardioidaceae bacterium]
MFRFLALAVLSGIVAAFAVPADASLVASATSPVASAARRSVHIDFVRYNPAGPDTGDNKHVNKEVVVITNGTRKARSLTDWTLWDRQSYVYRFRPTVLRPGRSVTVHTGNFKISPGHRYWGNDFYVWDNRGDAAILRTRAGGVVDVCRWGEGDGRRDC